MMTRREFLKSAMIGGALRPQFQGRDQFRRGGRREPMDPSQIPLYMYKIVSLDRWAALKTDFDAVRNGNGLSRNKTFRDSLAPLDFSLPSDFNNAKAVILLATFARSASAEFRLNGQSHRVFIPFQYFQDEWTPDRIKSVLQSEVLKTPGLRLADMSKRVPLKYLAGRSGLGQFGRNNLIFVPGMGSYALLHAYLTDAPLAADSDGPLEILDECRHCLMCDRICPTNCMSRSNFILDAGRCLTLYNENPGDFSNFILPSMHHALMGCMKCQSPCPANERIPVQNVDLEPVSEEETKKILKGAPEEALWQSVRKRLRLFPAVKPADFLPILKRNLGALIRA